MINLKIIIGSTRPNRFSEKIIPWVLENSKAFEQLSVEVLDLRDYPIPFLSEEISPAHIEDRKYNNKASLRFSDKILEADAFIFITPEYNHGYSGVLKNAIDSIYVEWQNKPAGIISYGEVGGANAIQQLRNVLTEIYMHSVKTAVHIFNPWNLEAKEVDANGNLNINALDRYTKTFKKMLSELIWWSKALKNHREK